MSLKSKIEALIYAAEEPISLDQLVALLKDDLLALKSAAAAPTSEVPQAEAQPAAPDDAVGDNPAQDQKRAQRSEKAELRELLQPTLEELTADYAREDRGIEIRQVAGGYRMSTKPEHHDVIRAFAKSLKPPIRLSLPALETLAVIAYKQPVTVPEISEIRGVDAAGVIGTLLERKLITTAGRKAVVGRPMLYKTSKDFLLRFGLNDLGDLPSLEEFEKLAAGELLEDTPPRATALADATGVPDADGGMQQMADDTAEVPQNVTEPTVSSDPQHDQTDEQVADEIASESTGG
jgi:segregation and condensation protein B